MVFSTPCCANRLRPWQRVLWHALAVTAWWLLAAFAAQAQNNADVARLRVEQAADGLYLSATLRFELPPLVEEALLKGVPMTFVSEVKVFKDRWYWVDKAVATSVRSVRLVYQPLTRRWRMSVGTGSSEFSSGASLSQGFERLADALAAVCSISRWKIADNNEIDPDARHHIDLRFRLDTNQLPRPMQIGITGNADWAIAVQRNVRLDTKPMGN